ncbi:MAG: acyl-CoA dehydrogenase family protein [Reyranella sp.]|nr:acyl-CoA dehydrogenase family protein [Reyranella sp.]
MDMRETAEDRAFREEVRAFVRHELPAGIKVHNEEGWEPEKDEMARWHSILARKGWLAPSWPKEHGGTGWSLMQRHIFEEECALNYCPPLHIFNIAMIGPILIEYGTEAQKRRYLSGILEVKDWWCQGYSEPDAGSDLAALKTEARREGDYYILNGTKVWTSLAHWATHIFCLVRTRKEGKPQQGISFLLVDMASRGISIQPIPTINGQHIFNQVVFENVRVPIANLVHKENEGWTVAKSLLEHERLFLARVGDNKKRLQRLKEIARRELAHGKPLIEHDWFRRKLAQYEVRVRALDLSVLRFIAKADAGGKLDPSVTMLKMQGTELLQDLLQATVDALGYYGVPFQAHGITNDDLAPPIGPDYAPGASNARFRSRAFTIAGGGSEIQQNIMAKHLLG